MTTALIENIRLSKREKLTERQDLPPLPLNQQQFVELIINGIAPQEAYRSVQSAFEPNAKHKDKSISLGAARMQRNPAVQAWLQAMREAGCENGIITLQSHISELERLKNLCIKNKNYGAAVRAEELRGKTAGLYVDRVDVTHRTDSTDLLERVGKMFGEDFKKVASEKLGIAQQPVTLPVVTNAVYKEVDSSVLYDKAKEEAVKGVNKPLQRGFKKLRGEVEQQYKEASKTTEQQIREMLKNRGVKDV